MEKVLGVFKSNNQLCIATEYYQFNLREYLLRYNKDDLFRMKIFYKICKKVTQLHNYRLVHGHITPDNIFLNEETEVILADIHFIGIRKNMCMNGYSMKSSYSAPEILSRESMVCFEPYNDIYSLGILLWG